MVGRCCIYGIDYVGGKFHDVVDFIMDAHNDKAACLVGFAPMTSAAEAITNEEFRNTLNGFDIVCMDGQSIVRKVQGPHYWIPERCSGPDVMREIIHRTAHTNEKHFLYGTNEKVLEKLRQSITSIGANVVGVMAPTFRSLDEWAAIDWKDEDFYAAVKESRADYVWVALGAPKQEYFCMASKYKLPGVKVLAVGAAFNFLSGEVTRAPDKWKKSGFEWLWRMIHEPNQVWRYIRSFLVCAFSFPRSR